MMAAASSAVSKSGNIIWRQSWRRHHGGDGGNENGSAAGAGAVNISRNENNQ
jgi:hypothetical protein